MLLKMFPKSLQKNDDEGASELIEQGSDETVLLPSHPAAISFPNTANFNAGASGSAFIDSCNTIAVVISRDIWEKIGSPPISGEKTMNHFGGASEFPMTTVDVNLAGLTLMGVDALIDEAHDQMVIIGRPILNFFIMTMDRDSVQLIPNLKKVSELENFRPQVTLLKIR